MEPTTPLERLSWRLLLAYNRWFGRFERESYASRLFWYSQNGIAFSTDTYLARSMSHGGEDWYWKKKWHWVCKWDDGQKVSTIFLGLDQHFGGGEQDLAVLWETCVFGAVDDASDVVARYTSRFDAAKGHFRFVALVMYRRLKTRLRRTPTLKVNPTQEMASWSKARTELTKAWRALATRTRKRRHATSTPKEDGAND